MLCFAGSLMVGLYACGLAVGCWTGGAGAYRGTGSFGVPSRGPIAFFLSTPGFTGESVGAGAEVLLLGFRAGSLVVGSERGSCDGSRDELPDPDFGVAMSGSRWRLGWQTGRRRSVWDPSRGAPSRHEQRPGLDVCDCDGRQLAWRTGWEVSQVGEARRGSDGDVEVLVGARAHESGSATGDRPADRRRIQDGGRGGDGAGRDQWGRGV
jgi:hypothetical protein